MTRFPEHLSLLAAIPLPVFAFAGCASNRLSSDGVAWDEQMANAHDALITAGDPDSLSAAALLGRSLGRHEPDRLELIHRAAISAPDRFDIAWLDYQLCADDKSCDSAPLLARLQVLDPRNAVSWLGGMPRDQGAHDEHRWDAAISMMAGSDRFHIKWVSLTFHLANAIDRTKTMDSASAVVAATGIAAALAIPANTDISTACKGDALKRPQRLNDCRRLAAVMRRGDTLVTEMIGIAIATRVWPDNSDEYRDAAHSRRTERYRMAMAGEATTKHSWDAAYAKKYLEWLATCKSEQELLVAELRDAGIEPDPPSDWKESVRTMN